ncbi:MAG TPA: response regulator [Solirubrobacteraceae bacterium]|nr:response regulator [Solirubrobacteraceae bacterium]
MTLAAARDHALLQTEGGASAPAPLTRILFVHGDGDSWQRVRETMDAAGSGSWQVDAASSGEEALEALTREPADVVIADERLPEMDGVTLLTRVRDRHPTTIRMILSEAASSQRPSVAAIIAHRMLGKPCNPDELGVAVRRSRLLHRLTGDAEAYRRTVAAAALPSRPGIYLELNRVLSDPNWEPSQVSAVVERDVAMSAKVLQLANSALFGLTQSVTTVQGAVMYLGVDTIRSLALTAETFGKLAPRNVEGFSIDAFAHHAMLVAQIAKAILPAGRAQQEAVTAALLHDIGKLVLIADGSDRWAQLNRLAAQRGVPLHEVEQETEGVTHAELGAHLLSLWGLPDAIAEAVAHHHRAGSVDGLALDVVATVHLADALAHELAPPRDGGPAPATLDEALVERLDLRSRLEQWRHTARQLADRD